MLFNKVPKNDYVETEHGPVFNFFSTFGTYFLPLMTVNVVFLILNLPMLAIAFMVTIYFLPQLSSFFIPETFVKTMESFGIVGNEVNNAVGAGAVYQLYYLIVLIASMFLVGTTLFSVGPFQAGFSQIYRNIYRREGVFFVADFKEGMKKNAKQSAIAMLISVVTTSLILFAIAFYGRMQSGVGTAITAMFAFLFFSFIIIQNMVYQMIVSIDLPLKKIYVNAILFFLIKFIPCVELLIVELLVLFLIPTLLLLSTSFFGYAMSVIFYLVFAFVFSQYLMSYFTGHLINSYIVSKLPKEEEEDEELECESLDDEENDEDDSDEEDSPVDGEDNAEN